MCGGTAGTALGRIAGRGLSPRVRGNPDWAAGTAQGRRSIPACAGEPDPELKRLQAALVYPRVCGGTNHCCPEVPPP